MAAAPRPGDHLLLDVDGLGGLLAALSRAGYRVVGPTVQGGAITFGPITGLDDLPRGWTDEQDAGRYRLRRREDDALFGYAVGPSSLKQYLFAPRLTLVQLRRKGRSFEPTGTPTPAPRIAVLGARACDLAAVSVQDRVFVQGPTADSDYVARREELFVVAVQCAVAASTCFCVSMGTGPSASAGFDLALTELLEGPHRFVLEIGTDRGAAIAADLGAPAATSDDLDERARVLDGTRAQMGRTLDAQGVKALLERNLEHPRWDDVAARCLSCANCTMVCPTCFCSTVEDTADLSGDVAERTRRWDSCFTLDHSYVHGGSVRSSPRARYRQWLTHKLASWVDQFETSGCVGCGRCITWCPAAIDITQEVVAIRNDDGKVTP